MKVRNKPNKPEEQEEVLTSEMEQELSNGKEADE